MSDSDFQFLNLGGNGGAMTRSQSARVLGTVFQISPARPAFGSYQVTIDVGAAQAGDIELRVDFDNPPTTVVAAAHLEGDQATVATFQLCALVPPGAFVRLVDTTGGGGGAVAMGVATESVL